MTRLTKVMHSVVRAHLDLPTSDIGDFDARSAIWTLTLQCGHTKHYAARSSGSGGFELPPTYVKCRLCDTRRSQERAAIRSRLERLANAGP